ncbi:TolC family protein [Cyanobium sp. Morenito 9A2]|nr:TolC family protein [Cyanobium sp. Morenito 9A2]
MAWGLATPAADRTPTVGPAPARAVAAPGPAEWPSTKQLEDLGAGWPAGVPRPSDNLAPIPTAQLASLELATAVELADRRNPVIRQNYELLLATQNSLGAAYASWWPVINGSLGAGLYGQRSYYNYQGALSGVGAPASGVYATVTAFSSSYFQSLNQFDINWNLFDPARSPTIWQNKYLVRQAVDAFVIARRDNRLRTEQAYINLQRAIAKTVTGQQLVANDQLLYRLAQSRVRLGVASRLELAKQQTVLKTDQVNLVNAEQNAQLAQAELAELLHETNAGAIRPAAILSPQGSWSQSLETTIESALGYRKVIEQQLTAVKVNEAQAQIDLAVYRPTIALVNSLYWTKGVGYAALGPPWVGNARTDFWNASSLVQITFTGFDGGQARMSAAAAMRRARAAEAQVQVALNQVRREVQSFHAQAQQGRQAVLLAAARVKASSEALRLQSLRFNAGYGNVTDVVQAQQDLTQAVGVYIDQLADYNIALVSLARASGLSYEPDPSLQQQVGDPFARLNLPKRVGRMN